MPNKTAAFLLCAGIRSTSIWRWSNLCKLSCCGIFRICRHACSLWLHTYWSHLLKPQNKAAINWSFVFMCQRRRTSFAKVKKIWLMSLIFFPSVRVITPHIFFFPNIKWKLDNLSHAWPPLYCFSLSLSLTHTLSSSEQSLFSHIFHISKQFSIPGQVKRPAALCNGTSRWSLIGTDHRASLRGGGKPLAAVCQRGL